MATLISGLAVAAVRLVLELNKTSLDPDGFIYSFANMNFLTFAAFFFLFSVSVCVVVSLVTPAPSEAQISGLIFGTLTAQQKADNRGSYNIWDIIVSVIVIAIVVYVMTSFTG